MIRRYFKASAGAKILHLGPVKPGALDRTVCGHIIDRAHGWQDAGLKADGNGTPEGLDVCRSCDRMKDAGTMSHTRAGEARR